MKLSKIILLLFICSGCTTFPKSSSIPISLITLNQNIQQAIVVKAKPAKNSQAIVTAWQKENHQWHQIFSSMPAVIGRNGLAAAGQKREGDGKTPSGVYALQRAFGYEPTSETKLNYQQVTDKDLWVDDVQSPQYNQWIKAPTSAKSFERLKRDDNLYQYAIVMEYNTDPIVPGNGSAIFMHIWRNESKPTAGCVALSEGNLRKLFTWLDRKLSPVVVLYK